MKNDNEIIRSWEMNAVEWSRIIEQQGIASRKFTNPAILNTVKEFDPENILDLGCGEGWLTRALSHEQRKVMGVDASEALLEIARGKGDQDFYRLTYQEIIEGVKITGAPFDAVVLNFCLYQKDEVPQLLKALKTSLSITGHIFIQTLHPSFLLLNGLPYEDQWIGNSWKGLDGNFVQPHSWYARTLESWINIFGDCAHELVKLKEVVNENKAPISGIFILKKAGEIDNSSFIM
ncbi:MAG: class I SAM-dependent methyltransferase [Gillisia sp.]